MYESKKISQKTPEQTIGAEKRTDFQLVSFSRMDTGVTFSIWPKKKPSPVMMRAYKK